MSRLCSHLTMPPGATGSESTSMDGPVVEPDGVGPIRIGMSLAEARAHGTDVIEGC